MCFLLGFLEFEFRTTSHYIHTVLDEVTDELLEVQEHRTTFHKGNAVYCKARLQRGELIQLIEHYLCVSVTLHVNHNTDIAFGVILNIGDTFDLLLVSQLSNRFHQLVLHYAVRQLGDHNTLPSVIIGLDVRIRTNHHASATGLISVFDALIAVDSTACREIRSFHVLHQLLYSNILNRRIVHTRFYIINVRATTVNHLAQVMRWHVRCHTNCNTAGSVHQQVRETARQNGRLFQRVVEVILHIYGVLLDIAKHLFCQLRQTSLGITHSSCAITIDRTEVTLTIYEAITHCPRLCHTNQGTVN